MTSEMLLCPGAFLWGVRWFGSLGLIWLGWSVGRRASGAQLVWDSMSNTLDCTCATEQTQRVTMSAACNVWLKPERGTAD
jgi:hypothetical protein